MSGTIDPSLMGGMQSWPLTLDKFIDHAARWHGDVEVVSKLQDGSIERATWATIRQDAKRLSAALLGAGVGFGDRVATLAMNGGAHVATWYGIMGIGAVCHTLNPRLSDDHLVYIINHAEDRIIFADFAFQPILSRILGKCPSVERVIYYDGEGDNGWFQFIDIDGEEPAWGEFDENAAAGLCYTSGTTGTPKGVLYTHRSNYMHTVMTLPRDVFNLGSCDVVMPVVPMFHASAWGLMFSAAAVGAKLVLPGAQLDGASVYNLMETEGVTFTAGVPTVWQMLLEHIEKNDLSFSTLKQLMVGGAACSPSLYDAFERRGVEVRHTWGMTEMSPLGVASSSSAAVTAMPEEKRKEYRLKQGRVSMGVDMIITDMDGKELPHDGEESGYLKVKGCAVIDRYYKAPEHALDNEGYFDTGDVATIDPLGYMKITDRAKDVVKSGGEWISSVELENVALGHPAIALAAVLGAPHQKWGERPHLFVQLKPDARATDVEIKSYLEGKIAKWWMPDEVAFVETIPIGATGKMDKKLMRAQWLPQDE